ncbi:MAG: methylaspartate ammonia-lyase [Bacillota bacterium]|nr:methylaspartate ammonia-lyase [Bacillota bacterium]
MKITDVVYAEGKTGFYADDQRAIKAGAKKDGFLYTGEPIIKSFTTIRQAGESISVMLILEDGQIAYGDCNTVQYPEVGGRDPLFLAQKYIPIMEEYISPELIGLDVDNFKAAAEKMDNLKIVGKEIHKAIRYGVSQALLDASAKSRKITMCEVVKEDYNIEGQVNYVPIFGQSGDDRYLNIDKMIIKGVDVMPHGLINNVEEKLGKEGEKLLSFIEWIKNRIETYNEFKDKKHILHFDVYGTVGLAFDHDYDKMMEYFEKLAKAADPLKIRIEGPVDMEDREKQIEALKELTKRIDEKNLNLELVADEWCNTLEDIKLFADEKAGHMLQVKTPDLGGVNNSIEALLYCKEKGIGAYCGGTCNETDTSARATTHIALACNADQILAKPGMGVDEGFMIVFNEMKRVLAILNNKK